MNSRILSNEIPLSHRLRNETKEAHTIAERSGIMRDVLRGTVSREAYRALLVNLHAIYQTLEAQITAHRSHESLADVEWHALARSGALRSDIRAWASRDAHETPIESATRTYVQHLESLGAHAPALLLPHAYLRYLGDLYGGQIMERILTKAFPAYAASGFSFYRFDQIADVESFKAAFRGVIDRAPLQQTDDPTDARPTADAMVAEAQYGYELHAAIFTELASEHAAWKSA